MWISIRHLHGASQSEVPFAIGEVEEQRVGRGHLQVVLGDQARITRRPDCAIRCLNPEAARVLSLEGARACSRRRILPGVISGCDLNPYWSNIEIVTNIMAMPWQVLHLSSEKPRTGWSDRHE